MFDWLFEYKIESVATFFLFFMLIGVIRNSVNLIYVGLYFHFWTVFYLPSFFLEPDDYQLGQINSESQNLQQSLILCFWVIMIFFVGQRVKINIKYDKVIYIWSLRVFLLFFILGQFEFALFSQFYEFIFFTLLYVGLQLLIKKDLPIIWTIVFIFVVIYQVNAIILSGFLTPIIYIVYFVLVFFYSEILKSTIPTKLIMLLCLISIIFVADKMQKIKVQYRADMWKYSDVSGRLNSFITLLDEYEENDKSLEVKKNVRETTIWRLSYPQSAFSVVYEKTPKDVDYLYGESYLSILTKFVPRLIYQGKKVEDWGQRFGHRYSILSKEDHNTSMNMPLIAEGYANFGVYGVIIFFVFFGWIIHKLIQFLSDNKNSWSFLYVFVITLLFQIESNFSMMFGKIIIALFFVRFIIYFYSFSLRS